MILFSLRLADRRATAQTTNFVEPYSFFFSNAALLETVAVMSLQTLSNFVEPCSFQQKKADYCILQFFFSNAALLETVAVMSLLKLSQKRSRQLLLWEFREVHIWAYEGCWIVNWQAVSRRFTTRFTLRLPQPLPSFVCCVVCFGWGLFWFCFCRSGE